LATPAERPNPPFPDDIAGEIGNQLELRLAELIALSLAGKQLHWNAYGLRLRDAFRKVSRSLS
jgi:starvation-inducible DNA-binding protein